MTGQRIGMVIDLDCNDHDAWVLVQNIEHEVSQLGGELRWDYLDDNHNDHEQKREKIRTPS